ncbi:MAG TPA: hypothetical protein VFI37_00090 [Gaiellaceae bacterium]|jgi:hypothetical protein|nr:hypothetical protein [Gaiellaceae bacterium]
MSVQTPSFFAQVIQDHLELKRRNAALEPQMPLSGYLAEDPFDNHPLFKSEQQARVEDTMSGEESFADTPSPLAWPTSDDTFVEPPAVVAAADEGGSDENEGLWSRSRDFDWGD